MRWITCPGCDLRSSYTLRREPVPVDAAPAPAQRHPDLARRLFRSESTSWAGLAGVPRVWAEQRRRLSTQDLVLLEGLARDLERAVAMLRRRGRSGASDSARAVTQDESGQLLLESGWLRDLCRRVSQPGSE